MTDALIIDAARTPIGGDAGRTLTRIHPPIALSRGWIRGCSYRLELDFGPNGSAPAWKVSRAGAFAGSGNCLRHQSLMSP